MSTIGLVPGSFKPYHVGHHNIILQAAEECDEVIVFVSTSDRKRAGEIGISGKDMEIIWNLHIAPALPVNVSIVYGGSPVGNAKQRLIDAEAKNSVDTYVVYGDQADVVQNFPIYEKVGYVAPMSKYVPKMISDGRFNIRGIDRAETADISGTKMRNFIAHNDKESFMLNLPQEIDGEAVWEILTKDVKREVPHKMFKVGKSKRKKTQVKESSERVLKEYVSLLIRRG